MRLKSYQNSILFLIGFQSHFSSIWARIWKPFWILFGVKVDPNSVQDAFSSFIFFKNVIFTKTLSKPLKIDDFSTQDRSENDPILAQDSPQSDFFSCLILASILDRFGLRFGSILAPLWAPKSTPNPRQKSIKIKLRQHTSTRPRQETPVGSLPP